MRVDIGARISIGAVLLLGLVHCATAEQLSKGAVEAWAVHTTRHPEYVFRIEYPATWKVEEEGVAIHFRPPEAHPKPGGVTVVVFNEERTPPLPVSVTYTTVRVLEPEGRAIPVEHRDPSAATERYLVRLHHGRLTAEIRSVRGAANASTEVHESVFDRMALSFSLSPKH
jgi:hypothetical protein